MLKRLIAGKELAKLELYVLALNQAAQWFRNIPHARHVIDYIDKVANKEINPNVAEDITFNINEELIRAHKEHLQEVGFYKDRVEVYEKELQDAAFRLAEKEKELNRVHVKLAEAELKARQGWERYEEANSKYIMREKQLADLAQENVTRVEYTYKWFSALYECAQLMGIKVGDSISTTPIRLREFLNNRNFVFKTLTEVKTSDDQFKRSEMTKQIKGAVAQRVNYVKPGIPCNGCADNCCTLVNEKCALALMRKPEDE